MELERDAEGQVQTGEGEQCRQMMGEWWDRCVTEEDMGEGQQSNHKVKDSGWVPLPPSNWMVGSRAHSAPAAASLYVWRITESCLGSGGRLGWGARSLRDTVSLTPQAWAGCSSAPLASAEPGAEQPQYCWPLKSSPPGPCLYPSHCPLELWVFPCWGLER